MARSSSLPGRGAALGENSPCCSFQRVQGLASSLNAASLGETARLAAAYPAGYESIEANIADRQLVERIPERVIARFGTVDGVINNAGIIIQPFVTVRALDYTVIERVFNVNLMGTLYVTKAFLPILLERPVAHMVNLSSMGGFVPFPGRQYVPAKAGVKLLSEGLASELIQTNVRVTVVFPGAIATNITDNSGVRPPSGGRPAPGHGQTAVASSRG